MNYTSCEMIIQLEISEKEFNNHSQKRLGYHVYLSRYFMEFKALELEQQAAELVEKLVWEQIDDESSVDSVSTPRRASTTDVMKAAGKNWSGVCKDLKEAWKCRATNLNQRPRTNGHFEVMPRIVMTNTEFLNKIVLESLSMEWVNLAKMMKGAIRKNVLGNKVMTSANSYKFGRERIVLRSQSIRNFIISNLLKITIFGSLSFSDLFSNEIIYATKNEVVVHLLSHRRMSELLTYGGLDATIIKKHNGMSYKLCGKVILQKGGRSTIGYIMDENETSLQVKMDGDTVTVARPVFDFVLNKYPSARSSSNTYSLLEVDPVRIKLNSNTGYSSIILSSGTFNENNNLILTA